MNFPEKCVVDTSVPKVANLATQPDPESDVPCTCVRKCIKAIEHVKKEYALVIDAGDDIFAEYLRQLSMSGQHSLGNAFMKWVHDNRFRLPDDSRVCITRNGDSYDEFPLHKGLDNFDRSDRKFVAVANAHSEKPPVLQATDSKWWGWKKPLAEVGIKVLFLCPEYAEAKYEKKMGM